eukprot:511454-Prorocentrum_minimum.AAC.1
MLPPLMRLVPADPPPERSGFEGTNHPQCIHCGGTARPAILMFGDYKWVDDDDQEEGSSCANNGKGDLNTQGT